MRLMKKCAMKPKKECVGGAQGRKGSVVLQDSVFNNVEYGIITTFGYNSTPTAAGTLVVDNVNFVNTDPAIQYKNNTPIISGNRRIAQFIQDLATVPGRHGPTVYK